jgi:hypothetical protein
MTIERPMFPPRAESVDSFSLQPAVLHRADGSPSGDSPRATEGLSRRHMLTALAVLPVALPAAAADPIFAALEAFRLAEEKFYAVDGDIPDEVGDRWSRAIDVVIQTRPTTPAGLVALTGFVRDLGTRQDRGDAGFGDKQWSLALAAVDDAARGMAGLQPWSLIRTETVSFAPDPVFDLIEAHRAAFAAWMAALALQARLERAGDRDAANEVAENPCHEANEAFQALVGASATTMPGLRAKVAYFEDLLADHETNWMLDECASPSVLINSFAVSLENIGGQA